jgi:hypothetical protein
MLTNAIISSTINTQEANMTLTGEISSIKKGGSATEPFYVLEIAGQTVFSKDREVEGLRGKSNTWDITETKNGKLFLNYSKQNFGNNNSSSQAPQKENKGFQYKADPDKVFSQEAGTVLSSATGIAKSFIEAGVFKNPVHNEIGDFISELYEYIFNKKIKIDKSIKLLQEVSDIFGECEAKNEGH